MDKTIIELQVVIKAPLVKVWECWNGPEHIVKWNSASPDWHTPWAEVDLKPGGKFISRMEAKDGSMGFDFWGIYDVVEPHSKIEYTMGDQRKAWIHFTEQDGQTQINESFEAESENSIELQRGGWQAILDHFKSYVESH